MIVPPNIDEDLSPCFVISGVVGLDWWLMLLLPSRLFAWRCAQKLKKLGDRSFVTPNGRYWEIIRRPGARFVSVRAL